MGRYSLGTSHNAFSLDVYTCPLCRKGLVHRTCLLARRNMSLIHVEPRTCSGLRHGHVLGKASWAHAHDSSRACHRLSDANIQCIDCACLHAVDRGPNRPTHEAGAAMPDDLQRAPLLSHGFYISSSRDSRTIRTCSNGLQQRSDLCVERALDIDCCNRFWHTTPCSSHGFFANNRPPIYVPSHAR